MGGGVQRGGDLGIMITLSTKTCYFKILHLIWWQHVHMTK
jgi:hypothetical protein